MTAFTRTSASALQRQASATLVRVLGCLISYFTHCCQVGFHCSHECKQNPVLLIMTSCVHFKGWRGRLDSRRHGAGAGSSEQPDARPGLLRPRRPPALLIAGEGADGLGGAERLPRHVPLRHHARHPGPLPARRPPPRCRAADTRDAFALREMPLREMLLGQHVMFRRRQQQYSPRKTWHVARAAFGCRQPRLVLAATALRACPIFRSA